MCCDDEQDDRMDTGDKPTCGGDGKVSPDIMCTAHKWQDYYYVIICIYFENGVQELVAPAVHKFKQRLQGDNWLITEYKQVAPHKPVLM